MADLTGQMLGRYRLEVLLGKGGMAAVYRAFDQELRRAVAIKVILTELVTDDNFLKRFKQEAELVAHLDHPNILPVYDFGEDAGRPYLVMPLREGGSLEGRMHSGVGPEQALSYISQMAEALDAAHRAGVLHRDVKPANVLLGKDDHVYLADFGIAKLLEAQKGLTATGMVVGTPTYMAPEQAAGKPTVPASDRYALAVVAFELLSGKPPFRGESALAVLHQHVTAPVPPISKEVPGLPASVDAVLRKALSKDPEERHPTCREFARELSLSVSGQLFAVAAPGSPRTGRVEPEAPTEALSVSVSTPVPRAPSLGTPQPATVLTGATTVTAPAAPSPSRRLWPLWMVAGVAVAVALVIVAGSRQAPRDAAPAPVVNPATPELSPSLPPRPFVGREPETKKAVAHVLVPTPPAPGNGRPPGPPPPPEAGRGAPGMDRPLAEPPPLDAVASVLASWESFKPQVRYGHRPDMAEFQRALTVAQQARRLHPSAPPAVALEHYARGGIAYLSDDATTARAELGELAKDGSPFGPYKHFRDVPEFAGTVPDWALALAYLDPRREAFDLLDQAERRGDRGVERGRRLLAKIEGEEATAPGPGSQAEAGGGQPGSPSAERPRPLRDRLRELKPKRPPE